MDPTQHLPPTPTTQPPKHKIRYVTYKKQAKKEIYI